MSALTAQRTLSVGLSVNGRTQPVIDGSVKPRDVAFMVSPLPIGEMFWRQLKFGDFDVSEMSLSSLAIATSRGPTDWVALPIFTMRSFFHTGVLVRTGAGISSAADLRGKRVGVLEYQQTSVVWIRGWLQHDYGIAARDMEWFMQRSPATSHGGSTGFKPPEGVRLTYVPPASSIGGMMIAGELDVLPFYPPLNKDLVDRTSIDISSAPNIVPLFPDPAAEARRYHAQTKIFPVNHGVVVRRSLVEKHPEIARDIYDCFVRANAYAMQRRKSLLEPASAVGLVDDTLAADLAGDPLAYGVKANRPTLDALFDYIHEQGLSSRRVKIEEVFAESVLDL